MIALLFAMAPGVTAAIIGGSVTALGSVLGFVMWVIDRKSKRAAETVVNVIFFPADVTSDVVRDVVTGLGAPSAAVSSGIGGSPDGS